MSKLFIIISNVLLFNICNGAGGPYPGTFDCPMRQLALEFALEIQPFLDDIKLQEIADALNGSPEKSPKNCTISPNNLLNYKTNTNNIENKNNDNIYDYGTIFIDYINGNDLNNNIGDIKNPFKTINYGLIFLRNKYNKNTLKKIILRQGTHYLMDTIYLNEYDSNLMITNYNNENTIISGGIELNNLSWNIYKNDTNGYNIYQTKIPNNINITEIKGLRINNERGIRARYPNANPEIYPPGFGSTLVGKWFGADTNPKPETLVYPENPFRNDSVNGYFQHYNLGIGGICENFEPPAGYWCSSQTQGGGAYTYRIPKGMSCGNNILPNSPYVDPIGGVIQTWRPAHWSSWMFEIGDYTYDKSTNENTFHFSKGGFQGARGNNNGDEFYVENIFEELDANMEWFFNETTRMLYYKSNETNVSPTNSLFEATKLKVLINMTGNMNNPVKNIEINGVTFRDSSITYLDPHGMPSGGDWALQRTGSLYLDGTQNISIHDNIFTKLDNIGISINRYNRHINIYQNEFVWLGASAITLWGDTQGIEFPESSIYPQTEMGYDGTNGNQPRYINISYNYIHEIGIWEKQSSCIFQSKSCLNIIENNICYNGPRAGFNINDGFGGGSIIQKNLIFNTCRESGDHGPINTWDRQVYVTSVLNGTPSFIKAYDNITKNFLISNYQGIWAVDNDDGSSFYNIYNNFLVYATGGLKNNFGGHNIRHYNNIYGYVQNYCFVANNGNDYQLPGYNDYFMNNICILNTAKPTNYGTFACNENQDTWPKMGNNTIYIMNNTAVNDVGLCGKTEKEFQTENNRDLNTNILYPPNDELLLQQAKNLLWG